MLLKFLLFCYFLSLPSVLTQRCSDTVTALSSGMERDYTSGRNRGVMDFPFLLFQLLSPFPSNPCYTGRFINYTSFSQVSLSNFIWRGRRSSQCGGRIFGEEEVHIYVPLIHSGLFFGGCILAYRE